MLFIHNPKLRKLEAFMQITQYLYEGNEDTMKFGNEQHRNTFLKEIKNRSFSNYRAELKMEILRKYPQTVRPIEFSENYEDETTEQICKNVCLKQKEKN